MQQTFKMAHSRPITWWQQLARWLLPAAGGLVLLVSLAAMAAIWHNVQDMEKKRCQEHDNLAQNIGETAKTFILGQQFDNFSEILRLLGNISFIDSLTVALAGRTAFKAGKDQLASRNNGKSGLANPMFYPVQKALEMDQTPPMELKVVFSLAEFQQPKRNIMILFGLIGVLLLLLAGMGYLLIRTNQRLIVAEETKKNMIYAITHDAKQDLFIIQGKISSLLPKVKNHSTINNLDKDLKIALESAESIDRYLSNLKDQESLVKGRVEIMRERVELRDIVIDVAEAFAEKAGIRKMKIEVKELPKDVWVYIDPQVIKRVLMNLLHNALKYSPLGGTITLWQVVRSDRLETYIQDQGQGIAEADWQRIFLPYVQLDPKKEGMGLGLATAKRLIEIMDGTLRVSESRINLGTTLVFSLPLCPKNAVKPAETE